ncbi:MAG: twin-arginine translocation signal domain-containing protein, partial [Planctomycetaceae bacterium]|nr:twin-arginine translocation signal domain-containing protein [Planctomycetaceae bacterium]
MPANRRDFLKRTALLGTFAALPEVLSSEAAGKNADPPMPKRAGKNSR